MTPEDFIETYRQEHLTDLYAHRDHLGSTILLRTGNLENPLDLDVGGDTIDEVLDSIDRMRWTISEANVLIDLKGQYENTMSRIQQHERDALAIHDSLEERGVTGQPVTLFLSNNAGRYFSSLLDNVLKSRGTPVEGESETHIAVSKYLCEEDPTDILSRVESDTIDRGLIYCHEPTAMSVCLPHDWQYQKLKDLQRDGKEIHLIMTGGRHNRLPPSI